MLPDPWLCAGQLNRIKLHCWSYCSDFQLHNLFFLWMEPNSKKGHNNV